MTDRMTDREMLILLDALSDSPLAADDVAELAPIILEMLARYRELLRETIKLPANRPVEGIGEMIATLASRPGKDKDWAINYVAKAKGMTKGAVREAHRRHLERKVAHIFKART